MHVERRAQADTRGLKWSLRKAAKLADKLIHSVTFSDDDHLGFMILAFLSKLVEQSGSVRLLIRRGAARDARLVSRSMIEAMVSVLWASQDPADRAFRWRGFAYVEDFRLIEARKKAGGEIDSSHEREVMDFLRIKGTHFVDQKRAGTPDPYYKDWRCGVKIKSMFDAVGGIMLYTDVYSPSSDWMHSGTASFGRAIARDGRFVKWMPSPATDAASSLATAFQSLAEVLKLGVEHFGSKLEGRLQALVEEFETRFAPTP